MQAWPYRLSKLSNPAKMVGDKLVMKLLDKSLQAARADKQSQRCSTFVCNMQSGLTYTSVRVVGSSTKQAGSSVRPRSEQSTMSI